MMSSFPQQQYCTPVRPLTLTAMFLWFLISVLLIASTGGPSFVQDDVNLGAFQICPEGFSCLSIDSSCAYSLQGFSLQLPEPCSEFQAFRAFLLLGLLLSIGVSALTCVAFVTGRTNRSLDWWLMNGLMAGVQFCVMVSFSTFADYFAHNFSGGLSKGDSFNLEVAAWCFGFVAWALWDLGCRFEVSGGSGWSFGAIKESSNVRMIAVNGVTPAPAPMAPMTAGVTQEPPAYQIPAPTTAVVSVTLRSA